MHARFPPRPALTVAFICAVAFWAACSATYSTGDVRSPDSSEPLIALSAAVLVASLALTRRAGIRMGALVVASLAAGALLGCSQAASIHASAAGLAGMAGERVELELLEDSVDYGFGETALVRGAVGDAGPATFSAKLGGCGPLLVGQRVVVRASVSGIDYASDRFAWQDGSCGSLKAEVEGEVTPPFPLGPLISLRAAAIEGIGGDDDGHALLQALVCGYRRNVRGTEMYAQFQTCGLAHLVAVSGAHLVIVTGVFASLLKRLRVPRRATIALLIAVMASYYVISGMPVSALRAVIMSALGLLSYFGKRRPSSLNAVGIGLFAIVASSPCSCVSASLALSVLSTAGIVLFGPLVQAWLSRTPLARAPFALEALSLTLASSLLSQLYACSLFNQLPLVSPLANIAAAPLFPLVCGAGLLAGLGAALAPGAPGAIGTVSALLSSALSWVVGLLAGIPFASVPFTLDSAVALAASACMALALWAWWPRPRVRAVGVAGAVAAALTAVALVAGGASDRIVMLDVGQGDSILVQSRGSTLLIDTGNQDSKLLQDLAQNRIIHLDSVLVTHADDDHFGSLDLLERNVDVDRVIVARDMLDCRDESAVALVGQAGRTAREVVGLAQGDSFQVGAFTARVVWPRSFTEDGGNADSLCVLLEYDGDGDGAVDCTALMTGDAEHEEIAEMVERGLVGDIDILKVGHHGSRNGLTEDEARVLDPEVALISCGARNRYGHPAQETLDLLEKTGAEVFRTDRDGSITCLLAADRIRVEKANR